MSRNSAGVYSLPGGNPVTTGSTISSSWANTTMSDLATAMTGSLARNGDGGMTGQFKADAGAIGAPGISWSAETTSGWYRAGTGDFRFAIAGNDIITLTASGVTATWTSLAVTGNATIGGTLGVTGAVTANAGVSSTTGFTGPGSALTALNASNLASGTVPDARFPATLPAVSGANLTNLNGTAIASGTVADARLSSNVPLKNAANYFSTSQNIQTGAGTIAGFEFAGNGNTAGSTSLFVGQGSDGTGYLYQRSALSVILGTSNTSRLTINAAGNTSISAPGSGTTLSLTSITGTGRALSFSNGTISGSIYTVASDNSVQFGVDSAHSLLFYSNGGTNQMRLNLGATVGSATDQGNGTLNAANGLYQGGVLATSLPAVTSTSTTLVAGQAHYITGNATLPALTAGQWVAIINNSGSPITITESSGYTTYWTASGASISTVTLAARGRLFAEGIGSTTAYVSGDITGST